MGVSLGGEDETTYSLESAGFDIGSGSGGGGSRLSEGGWNGSAHISVHSAGSGGVDSGLSGLGAALDAELELSGSRLSSLSSLGKSTPSVDEIASSFASLDAFTSSEGVDAFASSEGSSGTNFQH